MSANNNNALNATASRRSFLKMTALASVVGATSSYASSGVTRTATDEEVKNPFPGSKMVKTICTVCSVGCGVVAEVQNGVWVRQEVAQDHPVSLGGVCCKGASMIDMVRSEVRLKYPMEKVNGQWKRVSWDEALDKIANQLKSIREKNGPDGTMFIGSAKMSNEQAYYFRKFAAFYGTNNIDHQARLCHSSTVTGVANTFGYGAMTNHLGDIQNAKAVLIMGANPAVAHPVGFQHFLKAKEKNNTKLIVVEPRYTKTAAKADLYARSRSGTDIAFMYGMIHLIIKNGWEDKSFLENRVFGYEDIFEEAKKWTPEVVEEVTGVPADELIQITKLFATSKPACLVWTMGLTQHSIATGNTRLGPILQMILGNMGVEGGGCNILRGHDNVQGASDMGCSSETLPGYYGLAEGAWKHFANVWKVDFDYIKGRFKDASMLEKNGFTLARWYEGVLQNETIYNAGTDLKALVVLGCGITSTAQIQQVKRGLDNVDLLVLGDPFVNEAAVLTDKKDNVFLLPISTQFESSGSVTATGRNIQWRTQVVEPLYESKTDHFVMFELAKRLGFYGEYTKSMGDGNGNFQWPEDATREITRAIKTIGMAGHTPERLKNHQENWHLFDSITLKGKGALKDEYYGLPWPCWTPTHSGSPILYNVGKAVSQGGMGFRAGWTDKNAEGKVVPVIEKDGKTLLAGNSPVKSSVNGGYKEITDQVLIDLGITFTPEEAAIVKGKNWKNDISGILIDKAIKAELCPYGNGKARAIAWNFPDKIPLHREPIHSPSSKMVEKYPTYPDKKDHFRVDTQYASQQNKKDWSKEFPIVMVTGRLVTHSGAGAETRASKYLSKLDGEMFVDINPNLAATLGIKNGEMVWVHGVEGTKIHVKAKFSHSVDEKTVFMPFHFMGKFQGEDLGHKYPAGTKPYATGESCNTVVGYGYDIMTQIPETKTGLCRITKA
ncbi:molybdopterin-dependent oxidoreductase [Aliarcobacter butzleri]|uniref:molybdopterin-dependent oxidoreductase n=1 Tax=Aliarcobacter butzleri TaxID=28197 RepID=UPI0021B43B48|nr:molybdopterin-dependent oxidoreductase [Aliarcobacter butzleri]MCT7574985.1 molybdopterin-dependent oxidoreductase [Aliarcobacter butzleri]MCT7576625.1 molybdopterin-dependent oxidoreductase [Aliarcobacter butzleri]